MKVVIIQPPIVQLNTPYPSGAYLQDFFKKLKSISQNDLKLDSQLSSQALEIAKKAGNQIDSVIWKDFSIELFHKIFSKEGLKPLFEKTKDIFSKNIILKLVIISNGLLQYASKYAKI